MRISELNIGSEFYLPINHLFWKKKKLPELFDQKNTKYFSTGRDSIIHILRSTNARYQEVLLPAYICSEAINPFIDEKTKVRFYSLKENLMINLDDIKKRITSKTKIIIVIHYFGFPQEEIEELCRLCKEKKIILVEDCVHGFMTKKGDKYLGLFGDFSFTSFRKYVAIPDGSLLIGNKGSLTQKKNISIKHFFYVNLRYFSLIIKGIYMNHKKIIPEYFFFRSFKSIDKKFIDYKHPAPMSLLSLNILKRYDFEDIKKKRQENFRYLLKEIKNKDIKPMYDYIDEDIFPIGFPIISGRKKEIKEKLINKGVFPPVHWILPEQINKKEFPISKQISENILTLPIDQRYCEKDMKIIADILNKA